MSLHDLSVVETYLIRHEHEKVLAEPGSPGETQKQLCTLIPLLDPTSSQPHLVTSCLLGLDFKVIHIRTHLSSSAANGETVVLPKARNLHAGSLLPQACPSPPPYLQPLPFLTCLVISPDSGVCLPHLGALSPHPLDLL